MLVQIIRDTPEYNAEASDRTRLLLQDLYRTLVLKRYQPGEIVLRLSCEIATVSSPLALQFLTMAEICSEYENLGSRIQNQPHDVILLEGGDPRALRVYREYVKTGVLPEKGFWYDYDRATQGIKPDLLIVVAPNAPESPTKMSEREILERGWHVLLNKDTPAYHYYPTLKGGEIAEGGPALAIIEEAWTNSKLLI